MAAIYDGEIYCDECADAIKNKLRMDGKEPGDLFHLDTYHSDKWPKDYPDDTVFTRPEHCINCDKFLENPLCSDGDFNVSRTIANRVRSGEMDSVAITVWAPFYNFKVPVPNSGFLKGMQCPNCFSYGEFIISVICSISVSDDGYNNPDDCDWNNESACECPLCGFDGKVGDFRE